MPLPPIPHLTPANYCTGGASQQLCPPGTFGAPGQTGLASASCSGQCQAGYWCGVGSTSPTQNQCGGVGVYCPTGASAPIPVSANFYTTPAGGSTMLRTNQAACPSERACSGGVVLPGVDLSPTCGSITGGTTTLQIRESQTNVEWGTSISVSTPGYSGGMAWSVVSVTPADGSCALQASWLSINSYSGYGAAGVGQGRRLPFLRALLAPGCCRHIPYR